MTRLGAILAVVLVGSSVRGCLAQPPQLCFSFLLQGNVSVVCDGKRIQITRQGDISQFAVSDERSSLAFITSRLTKRTATAADAVYTTTIIDLKSGNVRSMLGPNSLISTCGGIFWAFDERRERSGTRDLTTGEEIIVPFYTWFRCSSDRRVVAGIVKGSDGDLYEGTPPQMRVASTQNHHAYTFNLSADGSTLAYASDSSPLCVLSSDGQTRCAGKEEVDTFGEIPSVSNTGEVLIATHTQQECFYKSPANFSAIRTQGASQDACLGVGYWKPGLKSIEIVTPIGRNPQWITSTTAAMLRDWVARTAGAAQK